MTTLLAGHGRLYADKRSSFRTFNKKSSSEKTDTAEKIVVPEQKPVVRLLNNGEKTAYSLEAFAFSGNVSSFLKLKEILENAKTSLDLNEILHQFLIYRVNHVAEFHMVGITTCGCAYSANFKRHTVNQSVNIEKNVFVAEGSGSVFDLYSGHDIKKEEMESKFISMAYMDRSSSTIYDVYDCKTKEIRYTRPSDEFVRESVLKFFNPHFYTGPKRNFA